MNCHRQFRRWFGTFNIHTSWPSTSISQLVPLLFSEQPPSLLVGLDSNESPQRSLFWPHLSPSLQFFIVPITTWHFITCGCLCLLFVSSSMSTRRTLFCLLLNPQRQEGHWAHGTKTRCVNVCWRTQKIRNNLEVYHEGNSKTALSRLWIQSSSLNKTALFVLK